jgi:hypothetical protein
MRVSRWQTHKQITDHTEERERKNGCDQLASIIAVQGLFVKKRLDATNK